MPTIEHTPTDPAGEGAANAFAVTECQDRLVAQGAVVRRQFWRRLLPSVGLTTYMAVSAGMGLGVPAVVAAGAFGLFTIREGVRFREKLARLRGIEVELASLTTTDRT